MSESDDSSSINDTDDWVFVPIVGRVAAASPLLGLEVGVGITMTPLVSAFFNELGRRLGSSCADWLKQGIILRFKPNKTELSVPDAEVRRPITIEIEEELSDNAWLALLDLDLESNSIRGKRLRWDPQAGDWLLPNDGHGP
jgi:hypothetical protein